MQLNSPLNWLCLTLSVLLFAGLAWSSFRERETRAFRICSGLALISALFWGVVIPGAGPGVSALAQVLTLAFAGISLLPFFPGQKKGAPPAAMQQYDERDTMFARNRLKQDPNLMTAYYAEKPELWPVDRQIHNKPDFGSPEQTFHDPLATPVYLAAFSYLEQTIPLSNGPLPPQRAVPDPAKLARTIREMVLFYGGCDAGITRLCPHHYYSRKGRHAKDWGATTDQTFSTAITIVVPMRTAMIKKAPTQAVLQESAQKYVEAAKISNILAGYLRGFGFRARAHNDANYEVLCVPLAVESGLGELGRMGLFMHHTFGPCVRLAVVTTDLNLPATPRPRDRHMASFCQICKKCADNCPTRSITRDLEPVSRGFAHWSIDQAKCFSFWKTIGSDCGLCIAVCPYTKPDTFFHRLVRFYISRNPLNQIIALFMDDLLYGRRKQVPRTNPDNFLLP